jgi:HSP90 family molecular chaperone
VWTSSLGKYVTDCKENTLAFKLGDKWLELQAKGAPLSELAKRAGFDVISAKQAMTEMSQLRKVSKSPSQGLNVKSQSQGQDDERHAFMVDLRCKDDIEKLGSVSNKTMWQFPFVSQRWHADL